MVEVIRDTVGRHDTFNLACTSKYYEDAWVIWVTYNCTDNFNDNAIRINMSMKCLEKGWSSNKSFF